METANVSRPVVSVVDLVKRYGDVLALDHFNLSIGEGEIFGLLGPNGCGKTTAMNCMLQLLTYDKGDIRLFGEPMSPTRYDLKRRIGVVPQQVAVFDELTVAENVDCFCALYVPDKKRRRALVDEAIEFVGLEDYRRMRPGKLSGGLLRRLNIACGIAHKPSSSSSTNPPWPWTRKAATPSWTVSCGCATRAPPWSTPAITWRKSSKSARAS